MHNLNELYSSVATKYVDTFMNDLTDAPWLDRFMELLPRFGKILDAGCGPGNFSRYLANRGFQVTGIDISRGMIREAKKLVPDVRFAVMDMCNLPYHANTFDGILAAYSFLHIPKNLAEPTLLGFRRILVPRGILCLMVKEGRGEHFLPATLAEGKTCYTQLWEEKEVIRVLSKCSFAVVDKQKAAPTSPYEFQFTKLFFLAQTMKPRRSLSSQRPR